MRGGGVKRWPVLQDVLRHQPARFLSGEVTEARGLRGDVERAAAGDHLAAAGPDSVVPDVPHAAEHDAVWEALGSLLMAGVKLVQPSHPGSTAVPDCPGLENIAISRT